MAPAPGPYGEWADAVLDKLLHELDYDPKQDGVTNPDAPLWLTSWASHEDTAAKFNPLATTYQARGSTDFNDAGVQNYVSLDQGVTAVVSTLLGHLSSERGYEAIVNALLAENSSYGQFRDVVSDSAWGPKRGDYWIPSTPVDWTHRKMP